MKNNGENESAECQDDSNNELSESFIVENTIPDYKESDISLKSSLYKFFGISLLILSSLILPLTIISFFYHPGQQDSIALLIEQIIGFFLFILGVILGISLLLRSKKMKERELVFIETISTNEDEIDQ